MTTEEIKDYINFVLDITNNGNRLSPPEYNNLLELYYLPYFRIKIKEYTEMEDADNPNKSQLFYDILTGMLSSPTNVTIAGGDGTLPATFGAWKEAYGDYSSIRKKVDLITETEYLDRMQNVLGLPFDDIPACIIRGTTITVIPNNITPLTLIYYTKPAQPVYDYYINASGKEVYMAEGATGVSVPAGGKSSSGTSGPTTVDSNTVELDFPTDLHEDFVKYLLSIMGIKTGDMNLAQYAEALKQEDR